MVTRKQMIKKAGLRYRIIHLKVKVLPFMYEIYPMKVIEDMLQNIVDRYFDTDYFDPRTLEESIREHRK